MKSAPLIADTGGLLRALAARPSGGDAWPDFANALRTARLVVIPALVLAEVDYFLGRQRAVMRRLVAEIFDPQTTYEFEPATPQDIVRGLELDAKFANLGAYGGFLVASQMASGSVQYVTITSQMGGALTLANPWGTGQVAVYRNGESAPSVSGAAIMQQTSACDVIVLAPAGTSYASVVALMNAP